MPLGLNTHSMFSCMCWVSARAGSEAVQREILRQRDTTPHPSLSPSPPWWRAVRMWSVRVLTEQDTAGAEIHERDLTQREGFKGRVQGSRELFLARSC